MYMYCSRAHHDRCPFACLQVFVNFQRVPQFKTKLAELLRHLQNKLASSADSALDGGGGAEFDVFLSYAWVNSHSAVELGHARELRGALGHGDPRKIKDLLREACDLSVWVDIEQVGRVSGGV